MTLIIPGTAQFDGARVAIMGMGISGKASVQALLDHTTATLGVWDAKESALKQYVNHPRIERVHSCDNATSLARDILAWKPSHIIIAPAFPERSEAWKLLHASGVPVWGEIELAWQLRAQLPDGSFAPWLGITGTNGKTTTTTMLAAILREAGLGTQAIGNVGNPAVTAVSDTSAAAPRAFALELSSFQLMSAPSMRLDAGICLNIADDHLEWHEGFESYRKAKARIYEGVLKACIYPVGDSAVQAMVDNADVQEGARAIGVVLGAPSVGQIGIVDGIVIDRAFGSSRYTQAIELFELADIEHLAPVGSDLPAHIVKDACAAAALARAIGIEAEHIRRALAHFPAGKHRIEHIASVCGVHFVDDSKATNAHAALASLRARRDDSVVWIAGGLPKGARFVELVEQVRAKIRAAIVIGVDQEPWREAFRAAAFPVTFIDPNSNDVMGDAVTAAYKAARAGDTVLLAPACASMDQFVSYADRGDAFAQAARALEVSAAPSTKEKQ